MLEVLLFAALLIAIARLWSKLTGLEQRLRELEQHGVPAAALEVPFEHEFQQSVPDRDKERDAWATGADLVTEDPLARFERAGGRMPSPLAFEPSAPEPLVPAAEEIEPLMP